MTVRYTGIAGRRFEGLSRDFDRKIVRKSTSEIAVQVIKPCYISGSRLSRLRPYQLRARDALRGRQIFHPLLREHITFKHNKREQDADAHELYD